MFNISRNIKNTRMCCVCRQRCPKQEMIRVAHIKGAVVTIDSVENGGRGVYVCKQTTCIEMAVKKKCLSRSLKCEIPSDIYEKMSQMINNI